MNIVFTADLRFGDTYSLRSLSRPFNSIETADLALIENWNQHVGENDCVYVLGNFSRGNPQDYRHRLRGKIYLVRSDHDHVNKENQVFDRIYWCYMLRVGPQHLWLAHYPHLLWPKFTQKSWHLYGRTYAGSVPHVGTDYAMDVTVDSHTAMEKGQLIQDYSPYSYEEVATEMARREAKANLEYEQTNLGNPN